MAIFRTNCAIARGTRAYQCENFWEGDARKNIASEICFLSEADIGNLLAVSVFYVLQVILQRALENDIKGRIIQAIQMSAMTFFRQIQRQRRVEDVVLNPVRVYLLAKRFTVQRCRE